MPSQITPLHYVLVSLQLAVEGFCSITYGYALPDKNDPFRATIYNRGYFVKAGHKYSE